MTGSLRGTLSSCESLRLTAFRPRRRLTVPIQVPARFLESVIGADMAEVDNVLRESLASDVALIRQIAEYIVGSGGYEVK